MPKYTLNACHHSRTRGYGRDGNGYFTCLSCFQRLRFVPGQSYTKPQDYLPAPPWDGQCLHVTSFLVPLETKKGGLDRAHCDNCGCVVEHPAGPGEWTPVLFYRLLIQEETVPSLAD